MEVKIMKLQQIGTEGAVKHDGIQNGADREFKNNFSSDPFITTVIRKSFSFRAE
jgi:hypothetical protein